MTGENLPRQVVVISIDAMTGPDLDWARTLPAFSRLYGRCALAERVRPAYPSLTYPCHVTMATGCWPERTGVCNNERFLPTEAKRPWYFYASELSCPTIFDFARAVGVSTGCVMWPCMGRGPIGTLVPEIWGETPDSGFFEPFCRAGSAEFIREIWDRVGGIPHGFAQPAFDDFSFACGMEVLKRRRPRILYLHLCHVDNAKHYGGLGSAAVEEALRHTDRLLGELLAFLDKSGLWEETAVVLCSDHGQAPVTTASYPNRLLRQRGLLKTSGGRIRSWRVQSHSACCSAQVYTNGTEAAAAALALFHAPEVMEALGVAAVYTRKEAAERFHLDGGFALVLEGKEGVLFRDEWEAAGDLAPLAAAGLAYRANHGHDPARGEVPFFLLAGPGVREGARLAQAELVDEPVTVACLCGFAMPGAQGRALQELLR